MRKFFAAIVIAILVCFAPVGCSNMSTDVSQSADNESGSPAETETIPKFPSGEIEEITKMYITVNSNKFEVVLEKNSSVDALVERLKMGDITYTADDYGGFEKVGALGFSLPTENTQMTTQAGDVMLYLGNQLVLFYGSNTYSYTRIGKINGYSSSQLKSLFGEGSMQVMISLI